MSSQPSKQSNPAAQAREEWVREQLGQIRAFWTPDKLDRVELLLQEDSWKDFKAWFQLLEEPTVRDIKDPRTTQDLAQLRFKQGQLDVLQRIERLAGEISMARKAWNEGEVG